MISFEQIVAKERIPDNILFFNKTFEIHVGKFGNILFRYYPTKIINTEQLSLG